MSNYTSMSDVLRALKEKSAQMAAGATGARDLVYIAKGMESLYGADMLLGMLEEAGKPAAIKNISSTTDTVELSVEDVSRAVVTIRNPADRSRRAKRRYALANIAATDIFRLTFTGLGDSGTGSVQFAAAGLANPSQQSTVDDFVARINNDQNWVVYTGNKTINHTVERSTGTRADGTTGDIFVIDGVPRPTLKLERGSTYIFNVSSGTLANYEFGFVTDVAGTTYNIGVTQSAAAQGTTGSTLTFVVPNDAPATLYYANTDDATAGNRYLMGNVTSLVASSTFVVYERSVIASRDPVTNNLVVESIYAGVDYNFTTTTSTTLSLASTATFGEVNNAYVSGADRQHDTPFVNVIIPAYGFSCVIRNEVNAQLRIKTNSSLEAAQLLVEPARSQKAVKVFMASDGSSVEEVFSVNGNTTPTTTKGDLEVHYGGGLGLQRLPIGQTGQVLSVSSSSLPSWQSPTGQRGDAILMPTQTEIDFYKTTDMNAMSLPQRSSAYFSGLSFFNPFSRYENYYQTYSGFWYKTSDGGIWRQGHQTSFNAGDESNVNANYQVTIPYEDRNKNPLYVEAEYSWTALVFEDGSAIFCGDNSAGHLGYGNTTATTTWSRSSRWTGSSPSTRIKKIKWNSGSSSSYCTGYILADDGTLWGSGYSGEGYGTLGGLSNTVSWTQIPNTSGIVFDNFWLSGGHRTFVWAWSGATQEMYVWGTNATGQLGLGNTTNITSASVIVNWPAGKVPKSVFLSGYTNGSTITTNSGNALVLMTDGTVWGTGANSYAHFANGNTTQRTTLGQVGVSGSGVQLNGTSADRAVDRMWHFGDTTYPGYIARMRDGSTCVWGYNGASDWMGRGDQSSNNYPTEVLRVTGVNSLSRVMCLGTNLNGTSNMVLALTDDGDLWTSGYNYSGFAGIGDSSGTYGNITPHGYASTFGWKRPWVNGNKKVIDINYWGYSSSNLGWTALMEDGVVIGCGYNGHYVSPNSYPSTQQYSPFKIRIGAR